MSAETSGSIGMQASAGTETAAPSVSTDSSLGKLSGFATLSGDIGPDTGLDRHIDVVNMADFAILAKPSLEMPQQDTVDIPEPTCQDTPAPQKDSFEVPTPIEAEHEPQVLFTQPLEIPLTNEPDVTEPEPEAEPVIQDIADTIFGIPAQKDEQRGIPEEEVTPEVTEPEEEVFPQILEEDEDEEEERLPEEEFTKPVVDTPANSRRREIITDILSQEKSHEDTTLHGESIAYVFEQKAQGSSGAVSGLLDGVGPDGSITSIAQSIATKQFDSRGSALAFVYQTITQHTAVTTAPIGREVGEEAVQEVLGIRRFGSYVDKIQKVPVQLI